MADVKVYLSHGLGVNSWSLYLYLIEQGEIPGETFEAVAVNHHTDWPETYEYLEMMLAKGYPVTVIEPDRRGYKNLYGYCFHYQTFPARIRRWCTDEFKVKPLLEYYQKPCVELIGFDVSEAHRAKSVTERDGVVQEYPLVAAGIDRQGCIEIIRRNGLPVPSKSTCFICPYQGRRQFRELRKKHPELFCKARRLEEATNERRAAAGKSAVYFRDEPLDVYIQSGKHRARGQDEMFDAHDRPPCRCGL